MLELSTTSLGEDHGLTVAFQAGLANVSLDMKEYDEAESHMRTYRDKAIRYFGEESEMTLRAVQGCARVQTEKGEFEKARQAYEQALTLAKKLYSFPFIEFFDYAVLCLAADQLESYRMTCQEMVDAFQDINAHGSHLVGWTCVLAPDALDDLSSVIEISRKANDDYPGVRLGLTGLGALLYRTGQYEESIEKLRASLALEAPPGDDFPSASAMYFLAMAETQTGNTTAGEKALSQANAMVQEEIRETGSSWQRRVYFERFRKEAEELLAKAGSPSE